jgi:hypothetical protein
MLVGTSHFVSKAKAIQYYQPYEYPVAREAVEDMLANGEIHIGEPTLRPGQRLSVIDGGARYAVEEEYHAGDDRDDGRVTCFAIYR